MIDLHSDEFLRMLMRKQFALSAALASVFIFVIIAVPLLNLYMPDTMNAPLLGLTLTWFVLGLGIFPVLIILAWLFVIRSNAFEDEAVTWVDPVSMPSGMLGASADSETSTTGPAKP